MSADPGRQILGETGPIKCVIAGTEGGHKKICLSGFTGKGIRYRNSLAGIVDKELFPGPVALPEAYIQPYGSISV
jgi:hypothetical protein